MMTQCPGCGSDEIVSDLTAYSHHLRATALQTSFLHVLLGDPARRGPPMALGFRAAICTACGHADLYTKHFRELGDAVKNGYTNVELDLS